MYTFLSTPLRGSFVATSAVAAAAGLALFAAPAPGYAQTTPAKPGVVANAAKANAVHRSRKETTMNTLAPTIVLVHGAWADGSSWSKVIPLLQAKGYQVVAVQNPLSSLADDVAATERVIHQQTGPVILVGHSWAGVVITQAGNDPKVKGLVYVDAFAPDSGQSVADVTSGLPPAPWNSALIKDEAGFLTLPAATIAHDFAQDLSPAEQGVIAATQGPWFSGSLTDKVSHAAWHEKPSWWVLGEKDQIIAPALQTKMANQIQAKVTKVATSHVAMVADPEAVTAVILAAADSVQSASSASASHREAQ
jgi:pimeloyl-ACP methyl ester carboxylesterase